MEISIESLTEECRKKDLQIDDLKRQINNLQIMFFGSQSEKQAPIIEATPEQPFLEVDGVMMFTEAEELIEATTPSKNNKPSSDKSGKKKKGGNQLILSDKLEVEDLILDVPESEKCDPITGEKYSQIDEEITKKLVRVKASYKIIRMRRPVYGARKHGVVKMDLPMSVTGFSKLDESFWAEVCVRRTCDHIPFYRQVPILARDDIFITRQSLNKTFLNIGSSVQELGGLLKQEILSFDAIHVDETVVKMQMPGKKKLHQAYLWVVAGSPPGSTTEPLVWMFFETNRKHENAEKLIEDYSKVVHSDAYNAYEKLADQGQFTWAPCWVHARRKFIKATVNDIQETVIEKFTGIMHMDNKCDELSGDLKVEFRKQHVAPMVDELVSFLEKAALTEKVMFSTSLTEACAYFLKRKKYFKAFLTEAHAQMDNNAAERSIRPLKIGNKNWLFIGSQAGGESCAVMTSLLQSARNIGLNPQEYLENVLRRLPYTPKEKLADLLPHKWKKKENPYSPFLPPDYEIR